MDILGILSEFEWILAACVVVLVGFFASWQVVLRTHLTGKTPALLVGMGAVPAVIAALLFVGFRASTPWDSATAGFLAAGYGIGAMIGGWVGASIASLYNQAHSGKPQLEQAAREVLAEAAHHPRRRTVNSRLRELGLPGTRASISLYYVGSFAAAFWFVAAMCEMANLGFWGQHTLPHLPLLWRLLGILAPVSAPGLLWLLTARRVRPLAQGLLDGAVPLGVLFAIWYVIANVVAVS